MGLAIVKKIMEDHGGELILEDRADGEAGRPGQSDLPSHRDAFRQRQREPAGIMAHDILIVDDEADIRMLVSGLLADEGYQTREAGNSDAAFEAISSRRPSLVLLDIWIQGSKLDGLEILEQVKRDHPDRARA